MHWTKDELVNLYIRIVTKYVIRMITTIDITEYDKNYL